MSVVSAALLPWLPILPALLRWGARLVVAVAALTLSTAVLHPRTSGQPAGPRQEADDHRMALAFDAHLFQVVSEHLLDATTAGPIQVVRERDAARAAWALRPPLPWEDAGSISAVRNAARTRPESSDDAAGRRPHWRDSLQQNSSSQYRPLLSSLERLLPVLLLSVALCLLLAAVTGAVRSRLDRLRDGSAGRAAAAGLFVLVAAALVVVPILLFTLPPRLYQSLARTSGGLLEQLLFITCFAAILPRLLARVLASDPPSVRFFRSLRPRAADLLSARLAVLDACGLLRPLVPALVLAAVFLDVREHAALGETLSNGLAALITNALTESNHAIRIYAASQLAVALFLLAWLVSAAVEEVERVLRPIDAPGSGR